MFKNNYFRLFIVVLSIFFLLELIFPKPFWLDECALGYNLITKDFIDLTKPLDMLQVAPIGYLLLTKIILLIFNYADFSFVLLNYITLIIIYYFIIKICIINEVNILSGLISILLIKSLLFYGFEMKQYIFDCLAIVYLLYMISKKEEITGINFLFLFFISYFSNISIVFIPVFILYYFLKSRGKYKRINIYSFIVLLNILFYFILFVHNHPHSLGMKNYWNKHFIKFDLSVVDFIFKHITGFIGFNFIDLYLMKGIFVILLFSTFLVVVISLFARNNKIDKFKKISVFVVFIVAVVLSYFKLYPLDCGRLTMYLIIPIILIIAIFFDVYVSVKIQNIFFVMLLLIYSINFLNKIIVYPIEPFKKYYINCTQNNEILYITGSGIKHLEFYNAQFYKRKNIKPFCLYTHKFNDDTLRKYLFTGQKVRLLGVHKSDIFDLLKNKENIFDKFKDYSTSNYLFDNEANICTILLEKKD